MLKYNRNYTENIREYIDSPFEKVREQGVRRVNSEEMYNELGIKWWCETTEYPLLKNGLPTIPSFSKGLIVEGKVYIFWITCLFSTELWGGGLNLKQAGIEGNGASETLKASSGPGVGVVSGDLSVKGTIFSRQSKLFPWLVLGLGLAVALYLYQEGAWMEGIRFCRYFFQPRRLHAYLLTFGSYGIFVFIFFQFVQVVVAPIPGEVTGFIGGLAYGVLWGTIFSTIGLAIGSFFAFFLARTFGVSVVRKVVRKEFMERFERFSGSSRGFAAFFVFFLIPGVPKDSVCYLLGLSSMTYADFMLINIFARLPGTIILSVQGSAVSRGHYGLFLVIFLASMAILAVVYPLRRLFLKSLPAAPA